MSENAGLSCSCPPQLILAVPEPMWKLRDALTHADRSPPRGLAGGLIQQQRKCKNREKKRKKGSRTHSTSQIDYFTCSKTHTWG